MEGYFAPFAGASHPLQFISTVLQEITIHCGLFPTNRASLPSIAGYFKYFAGDNHPLRFIPCNLQETAIRRWTCFAICGRFLIGVHTKYCVIFRLVILYFNGTSQRSFISGIERNCFAIEYNICPISNQYVT